MLNCVHANHHTKLIKLFVYFIISLHFRSDQISIFSGFCSVRSLEYVQHLISLEGYAQDVGRGTQRERRGSQDYGHGEGRG